MPIDYTADEIAAMEADANAAMRSLANASAEDVVVPSAQTTYNSLSKPIKAPGESNTSYNTRLTEWYKAAPKPELSDAQKKAGATVQFVRTGAAGEGVYKIVYPVGVKFDSVTGEPIVNTYSDGFTPTSTTVKTNGTATDSSTNALIQSLQAQIAAMTTANTKATENQRMSAIAALTDRFSKYGLGSLAGKIKELAVDGATEATITLQLQETPEYQLRFAANQDRIKKGLSVLSPAEYLANEDGYRQTLRAYGLSQFDNDAYVRQFIANDVSPAELSSRVSIAVQRVQNADPAVTKTLRDYYGIGTGDMIGYILDPNQALPKIQQQVATAEIGAAARRQGLEAGVTVAEQLARQGITEAEAQKGYATIADILPTAEKLSSIYEGQVDAYGQSEAEQDVFNSLASAQRKRQKLTAKEISTFSGSSGIARGSLGTSTAGTI